MDLPWDLKTLNYQELDEVARQVRALILEVVSKNGGHLAPSLGVVELTIAILRSFDLKKDNVIWDVGHQSYAYKILTDRLKSFHTLRSFKGISGFIKPSESPFDKCISGHTSTSISAALGVTAGVELQRLDSKTVAVIGDGAISGGMAFEALNNLGDLQKNMMIILNDNEMSINQNVGAFASYLSKGLTGEFATKVKKDIQNIFEDAPLGDKFLSFAKRVEGAVVGFFTPGAIFEELGIKYIGPINGHKIRDIEKAISNGFLQDSPVIIHVTTCKGKGYKQAEDCPDIFHGVSKFDLGIGLIEKELSSLSWTDVFGKKMLELAGIDDRVVAVTAAMRDGTGLKEFSERYHDRFFDVGIAEQHGATFCSGLATSGMRPYFAVYSTFLQRAFDQIIHDTAISKLPVTFCIDRAGLVGQDGSTHHGAFDMSYIRLIPNMTMMLPKDRYELEAMLEMTLKIDSPIAIRYPRGEVAEYHELPCIPLKLGEPEVVFKGTDILIISAGHIFDESYKLYKLLEDDGISVSLINIRFLKPLDTCAIISEARNKKLIVTVEDNAVSGGLGEMITAMLNRADTFVRVLNFGLPDEFVEHGSIKELRHLLGLDALSMNECVKSKL